MGRKGTFRSSHSRCRTTSAGASSLEASLDEYADQIVRSAPRFSERQRARISAILDGGVPAAGACRRARKARGEAL